MSTPPPDVAEAAAKVQQWLDKPVVKTVEEIARMSQAERLDYSRRFNQTAMPEWKDPRGA
jgi:hypothetical protein